jgi:hypothetical protein
MAALTLDTHAIVKELKAAGFNDSQAEAVSRVIRQAQDVDLSHLATKSDLRETALQLEAKIETARADTIKWMFGTIGFQTLVILGAVITLARGVTH